MPDTQFPRGRRMVGAVGVLALALGAALGSAGSAAGLPTPTPAPPPAVILDLTAKPVLKWSVPDRYQASWSAYNSATSSYDPAVINPTAWSLQLDGCSSTAVAAITGYHFTVARIGTRWQRTVDTAACRLNLKRLLPAQGAYRVSLTLHTRGSVPGVSRPASRTARIRDYLIVSVGDSLASGEGNPDRPGSYHVHVDLHGHVSASTVRAAQWKDRRCHRSANSGPARAAAALERSSPYTSVTFVSLACSGAEIANLIDVPYAGSEPIGHSTVRPQTEAVAALVGPHAPRGGRTIDSMLISAGINDLHFSDIIARCATNVEPPWVDSASCVTDGGIAGSLDGLRRSYALLAFVVAWSLPNTRKVYLNDYPANVFEGGGCGLLGIAGVGIDAHEGAVMTRWGERMNAAIATAARTFAGDPERWNLVGGLEQRFNGHAYCAAHSWFVSYEHSWRYQGNNKGTAHPNAAGQVGQRHADPPGDRVGLANHPRALGFRQSGGQGRGVGPVAHRTDDQSVSGPRQ
ncbi:MAG TPA: hypothetical protein VFC16_16450 [Nakamurella sp.]|nr:hypothetical protein [Nakamurella sp.]